MPQIDTEALFQAEREFEQDSLGLSVSSALATNPEFSAQALNLAEKKGLPYGYVAENYDDVNRPDLSTVGPNVAQLLRDRRKASISIDDIDNLNWWETTGRELGNIGKLVPASAYSVSTSAYSLLGSAFNALSEISLAPVRALNLATEDEIKEQDLFGAAGRKMMEYAKNQSYGVDQYMPKKTVLPSAVIGGIRSAIVNVPALAVGAVARNPNVALSIMGSVTYGDSYLKAKESGLSEGQSIMYATNQTLAEVVTERLPAVKLLEDIGADAGFIKTIAAQMALEIPGEQVATIWQDAVDWATLNPDKTLREFMDERKDAAIDTLISTVVATGLQTSAISAIDSFGKRKEREILDTIAEKATESKVRGRHGKTFGDFVDGVTEEYGAPDAVYLDAKEARALFQDMKKDDAYDLIASQIDEAEAVGGDIVITMGDFASKVATSENYKLISDKLRISPESATGAELETQVSRVAQLMRDANRRLDIKTESDRIYKDVTEQLVSTGRMTREVAKASAKLIPAYVATKAERTGLSVDEIYGMMGLRIVGPGAQIGGAALEQNDLQRALSMTEDEYIAAVNPTGKRIDAEDRMILHEGDIDLPRGSNQIAAFSDNNGVQVTVHEDQSGIMYAVRDGNVVGLMGPLEQDETVIDVVEEAKGSGVGKGLAAEFIKKDPFAQSGGFTPAGEANRRAAFRALKVAAGEGLKQEGRAEIYLLPTESVIKLGKASDLTSFLHEAGHLFLDMERKIYSSPNANEQIKADGDTILAWLGIDSFDKLDNYATDDVARAAHEKFARGFESYLGEGKAPSVELKGVFRRFAAWMRQIYLDLTKLNVTLTDEIRAVMDRMLASDAEIERVKGKFDQLFKSAEEAGMTAPEYAAYTREATNENGKEQLLAKMMKQLKRQYTQWWRDEHAALAGKITGELEKEQVYSAVTTMAKDDGPKLNIAEIKQKLGKVPARFKSIASEVGESADVMAGAFGFTSGDALIDAVTTMVPIKTQANRMAQQEMLRRHGDILSDGTIREEAEQAMRNPERAKKLLAELNALARKAKVDSIDRESIKAYARQTIGAMAWSKIRPAQYRAAEIRAARAAAVAKDRGDMAEAHKAKTQEVINFYLAKEAAAAKDRGEKIRASQRAIQARKYANAAIDKEHVSQAKVLLSAFDFRKGNDDSVQLAQARLASVANWIKAQQQNPDAIATYVQAKILGDLIHYKDMTLEELIGLNDVVQSILHAGRVIADQDKESYRRDIEEGIESIVANRIETYETEADSEIPYVKFKHMFNEATASMRKLESLARQADGMADQGWVWKHTIKPLLDAANNKLSWQKKAHGELREIFKGFDGAFSHMKDIRTFTTDAGQKVRLSYGARIAVALNLGNEGNLDALKTMRDMPLTDSDIANIVDTLNESDWGLVQSIWDYVDTYWKDISELELQRSGVSPGKVEARPFTTSSGIDMRGGYYPLVGDSAADTKQLEQDVDTQANAMMNGGAAAKSTKHGSTIERVGFGGKKIDLSMNVLFNHIDGVIHDITHWKAVKDVDRVLKNEKLTSELSKSLGKAGVKAMKQRLKEVAAGPQRLEGLGWINRVLRHARMASTYSALGYSVRTAVINMLGLTTAVADMSTSQIASATVEYYSNMQELNDLILSKSQYMQDRWLVLNRDIAQIRSQLRGNATFTKIKDNAFWMMTQTDKAITRPIWLAAYREGQQKFDTDQEAIDHADRMVARTQGSGLDMDLANVETRSELMKTMTVMYTAFSAIYNITTEQIKRYKAGRISGTDLAMRMAWLTVVPGLITALMTGSDDDEPEEKAKDVAWEIAGQALGMVPLARDAFSYARYGSSFPTPILRLTIAPIKFSEQLAQGEIDKGLIGATAELASWAHVPGGAQLVRSYGYLSALQDGEIDEFNPYDFLVTGKK